VSDRGLLELSALGSAVMAAACVPKVSANLVIDETRQPEHERRTDKPDRPKPPPGPDRAPPEIVRAELAGSNRVRIHFSEPIAALDGFDPTDFRISYLRVYLNQQTAYSSAYYYDVGYLNYGTAATPSQFQVRDNKLEIDFAPEVSPWFCRQLEYNYQYDPPGTASEAGLFLHYAAGKIPIRDEAGNQLANIGAQWVSAGREQPPQHRMQITGQAATQAGRGLVRVACGPPIPPGPR
jgi:hypothetical protein